MCQCGGANEHEHLSGPVTVCKSLFPYMANDHIVTLNGKNPASCTSVFREHFAPAPETNLLSDSDDQLIIHIAFSSVVKVKAVELFTSGLPQEFPVELKM